LGTHPSQIWWSILEGRDVLLQGLLGSLEMGDIPTFGMRIGFLEMNQGRKCD
jgi:hypothetical protein